MRRGKKQHVAPGFADSAGFWSFGVSFRKMHTAFTGFFMILGALQMFLLAHRPPGQAKTQQQTAPPPPPPIPRGVYTMGFIGFVGSLLVSLRTSRRTWQQCSSPSCSLGPALPLPPKPLGKKRGFRRRPLRKWSPKKDHSLCPWA